MGLEMEHLLNLIKVIINGQFYHHLREMEDTEYYIRMHTHLIVLVYKLVMIMIIMVVNGI